MGDENDDVTIDRSGDVPKRTDNRGLLHMLHDEIGKAIGVGRVKDLGVRGSDGSKSGLMDAVDSAVKDAPAPGTE